MSRGGGLWWFNKGTVGPFTYLPIHREGKRAARNFEYMSTFPFQCPWGTGLWFGTLKELRPLLSPRDSSEGLADIGCPVRDTLQNTFQRAAQEF